METKQHAHKSSADQHGPQAETQPAFPAFRLNLHSVRPTRIPGLCIKLNVAGIGQMVKEHPEVADAERMCPAFQRVDICHYRERALRMPPFGSFAAKSVSRPSTLSVGSSSAFDLLSASSPDVELVGTSAACNYLTGLPREQGPGKGLS